MVIGPNRILSLWMVAASILFLTTSCFAQVANGGFESGDFSGWTAIGDTAVLNSSLGISPASGSFQAFMASATDGTVNESVPPASGVKESTLESGLGITANSLQSLGDGYAVLGSGIVQSITAQAGQQITFSYDFLTNQAYNNGGSDQIAPSTDDNDFGYFSVVLPNGKSQVYKLADTFNPLFITSVSVPFISETHYKFFTFTASFTGTYKIGIGVVHSTAADQDNGINSGLLVDNVTITPGLQNLLISPTSVFGGSGTVTGTVHLTANAGNPGITIALASNNGAAVVPASVTVATATSAKSFTLTTTQVSVAQVATITASMGSATTTATLTVNPPSISTFTLSPTSITGGPSQSTGTVHLASSAPSSGGVVTLSSNNALVTVPATITVASGASAKSFFATTSAVATTTTVTLTATYQGYSKTATLTLIPGAIASVIVSPTTVVGGSPSTGTVHLSAPAGASGAVVTLSSDNPAATVPSSVTVAANGTAKSFTVTTASVASTTTVHISASFGGTTVKTTLTLSPNN